MLSLPTIARADDSRVADPGDRPGGGAMSRARGRNRREARSEVDVRPAGTGFRPTGTRPRRVCDGSAGTGWTDPATSGPSPVIPHLRRTGTGRSPAVRSGRPIASVPPDGPRAVPRTAARGASRDGLRRDALSARGRVSLSERIPNSSPQTMFLGRYRNSAARFGGIGPLRAIRVERSNPEEISNVPNPSSAPIPPFAMTWGSPDMESDP